MAEDRLGFVGIGRMGAPMAGRLIDAGFDLVVFDTRREAMQPLVARGATAAGSPREVAEAAATVITSLPTPDVVEQVALGPDGLAGGSGVRMMIDTSTTGPLTSRRVAEGLRGAGVQWLDAPVSGGADGAGKGTLAVMVSCPEDRRTAVEPILSVFGKVFFVGEEPGLAQIVKLANNMMSVSAILVAAEALALGVRAGVDPRVMIDIVNVSSGRNSATLDKFPRAVLPDTFDFGFAIALSQKDVRLCCEAAEALSVPMRAGNLARQMLAVTKARFGAESDFTSMVKVIEEWAGVEIRG